MNGLRDYGELWFAWMAPASVQLLILALLIAGVARIGRRLPATARHTLWLLVVLKAFLPPNLSLPFSAGALGLGDLLRDADTLWGLMADPVRGAHDAVLRGAEAGIDRHVPPFSFLALGQAAHARIVTTLFSIWSIGTVVMTAIALTRQVSLFLTLRRGRRIGEGPLHAALLSQASLLNLRRIPRLVLSAEVTSPFLCGLLRPCIVLPAGLPDGLSPAELRSVLTHELIHHRRGDVALCWLVVAAQCLFWFHPSVWIASRCLDLEREFCVDEESTAEGRCSIVDYGRALVNVAQATEHAVAVIAAAAFLGAQSEASELEQRIRRLIEPRRATPVQARLSSAMVMAFALVFLPMGPTAIPYSHEDQAAGSGQLHPGS